MALGLNSEAARRNAIVAVQNQGYEQCIIIRGFPLVIVRLGPFFKISTTRIHPLEFESAYWTRCNETEKKNIMDAIMADRNEHWYTPSMLDEHKAGRVITDSRDLDNVPWVRAFCDTLEYEQALDRNIDMATMFWCLELFAPGTRTSGPCDGLLLTGKKTDEGLEVFRRFGYYAYPSKDDRHSVELDRRFMEDFEVRDIILV